MQHCKCRIGVLWIVQTVKTEKCKKAPIHLNRRFFWRIIMKKRRLLQSAVGHVRGKENGNGVGEHLQRGEARLSLSAYPIVDASTLPKTVFRSEAYSIRF